MEAMDGDIEERGGERWEGDTKEGGERERESGAHEECEWSCV